MVHTPNRAQNKSWGWPRENPTLESAGYTINLLQSPLLQMGDGYSFFLAFYCYRTFVFMFFLALLISVYFVSCMKAAERLMLATHTLCNACGNVDVWQVGLRRAVKRVAASEWTCTLSSSPPGPLSLCRYTLLCSLSRNTKSEYFQFSLMAAHAGPASRKCQRDCLCELDALITERHLEKPVQAVYSVTGIILYLLSCILQFVNDCCREQNVHNVLLYKRHGMWRC